MRSELVVKGFHCKSCKMLVEDLAEDFPSIESCVVDVETGKVVIEHSSELDLSKFKKEIEDLGDYKVVTN